MKLALTNRFFFVSLSCEHPVATGVPSWFSLLLLGMLVVCEAMRMHGRV